MLKFEPSGFGFFMHKFMLPKKGIFIIKFYDKYKNIVAFKNGKGYNESMKIGIYANLFRDIGGKITRGLYEELKKEEGIDILLSDELRSLELPGKYLSRMALAGEADIVVVLGGDGTILRIAKECARQDAKLFSVNLGHRGFLAETEKPGFVRGMIKEVLRGEYIVDSRSFLEARAKGNKFYALNEVVVARGSRTRVVKCEVHVDGGLMDKYISDGVIVATPTGSTAYNLSAGGPIVSPDVEALVVTPISAHSMHSRPIVVNNKSQIWLEVQHAEPHAHLNIDGEDVLNLADGDSVTVTHSDLKIGFVRLKGYNYYERLLDKMRYWSAFDND